MRRIRILSLLLASMATAALPLGCRTNSTPSWHTEERELPTVNFNDRAMAARHVHLDGDLTARRVLGVIERLQYLAAQSNQPIDLFLTTNGGPARQAFAVIRTLRSLRAPVNTWAVSYCRSAGALILAAGTGRRYATPYTSIAIHGGVAVGEVTPAYERAVEQEVNRLWHHYAHLPQAWFPLQGDQVHYLTPKQAMHYGVIDAIAKPPRH